MKKLNGEKKKVYIIICSKGYPRNYVKNKIISNLQNVKRSKGDFIYHAGTKLKDEKVFLMVEEY